MDIQQFKNKMSLFFSWVENHSGTDQHGNICTDFIHFHADNPDHASECIRTIVIMYSTTTFQKDIKWFLKVTRNLYQSSVFYTDPEKSELNLKMWTLVCKLFKGWPKDMSIGLLSPFTHSLLLSLVWTLCVLVSQCFSITRAVSRAVWEMEKIDLCGALKKNLSLMAFYSHWHNRVKFQAVMELLPLLQCLDQPHGWPDLLHTTVGPCG